MKNNKIETFNVKRGIYITLFAIGIAFPLILWMMKIYSIYSPRIILPFFFGIIIIAMLETKYKLVITDDTILDNKKIISSQNIKSYYICHYGKKAFMFRITMLDNQQRFYISPEVEKKEIIIEFFKSCPKKQNFTDKLLLLYPYFLFLICGIAILIFSINL